MDREKIKSIYGKKLFSDGSPAALPADDIPFSFIREYIPRDRKAMILDAGCGNGRYIHALASLGYENVVGIDLFPCNTGVKKYICASIDSLPFKNESFDAIYSNSVIYYLGDPSSGISEFFRVLKSGGYVMITAHTKYSLFTLDRIIKRLLGHGSVSHLKGVRFHSSFRYAAMMKKAGFEIAEITGYSPSGFFRAVPEKGNRILAFIKSLICYHAILVARKP
jgi:SAM-dependent methyltransferase